MLNSFIVTGASASGKTTLINEARKGYTYLPTHMTRKPRKGEQNGTDAIFITEEQFINNFREGDYLEPSLDFALLRNLGIYYGTPVSWIENLSKEGFCASPVSIQMADEIAKRCDVCWVHLVCSDEDRLKRLLLRGISEEEAHARMRSGDSIFIPENADLIINTSEHSPEEILQIINDYKRNA